MTDTDLQQQSNEAACEIFGHMPVPTSDAEIKMFANSARPIWFRCERCGESLNSALRAGTSN